MATRKAPPKPISLNPEQQAVVEAHEGFYRCLAGPGSGKSECLVRRYARLVGSGVDTSDILSLTFTNSAGKSMKERAENLIEVPKTDRISGWRTFHGLALSFCTQEREHFPFKLADFPLATEPIAGKIGGDVARKYDVDPRTLRPWISLQKRNRVRPKDALAIAEKEGKNEKLALAYKMYESKLRESGQLDFDSLLFEMVDLLSVPPRGKETTERFALTQRWNYKFCQTDEAQDNDALQWALLRLMTQQHGNLLAVGDAGQNLYSFRGSSATMFMDMGSMFTGTKTLYLAKNHRSSPQVVALCKECGPIPELAELFHTSNPDGPPVKVIGYASPVDEAKAIVEAVRGVLKPDTSVLCRTNKNLRVVEDIFSTEGIKYYYQGRSGFWSQNEVKALLAYATCAIFPSDNAVMGAFRAPFHPSKYIKKTEVAAKEKLKAEGINSIQFLSRYADDKVRSFVHFLDGLRRYRDVPPNKAVQSILSDLRALEYYKEEESADNSPVDNLLELQKIAGKFSSLKEFLDYARRASQASKTKKGVCLSTVHAYKGLEAETVYFIAVQDGILPHAKSESVEDERNVFFVGISRAKRNLTISYSGIRSPFLSSLKDQREPSVDLEAVFEM